MKTYLYRIDKILYHVSFSHMINHFFGRKMSHVVAKNISPERESLSMELSDTTTTVLLAGDNLLLDDLLFDATQP
ncbi:hypothetical protein HYC85_021576 [Camellia sinensis]|uniref:Uncharacterized protein n=1 Tax=Camellia sinensis TaxID=4442 RepID=A0A7J7GI14_CAMSI|nr:hypothetical protein HYC85_021576 [Camellia sinensis]